MANREENLKKINAEFEQLSDEELEKIAGGIVSYPTKNNVPTDDDISEYAKRLVNSIGPERIFGSTGH